MNRTVSSILRVRVWLLLALLIAGVGVMRYRRLSFGQRVEDKNDDSTKAPGPLPPGDWSYFRGNHLLTGQAETQLVTPLQLKWSVDLAAPPSPAVIVKNRVVVASGGERPRVYALAVRDGAVLWSQSILQAVSASPCISEDLLFIGDESGSIYAFDVKTGERRWRVKTSEPIKASLIPCGENVLVASYDFNLYALRRISGETAWVFETDERIHPTPLCGKDRILTVGCTGVFRSVSPATGESLHEFHVGGNIVASPAYAEGGIYLGTMGGRLFRVDPDARAIVWDTQERYTQPCFASPSVWASQVFFALQDGLIVSLTRSEGREAWRRSIPHTIQASPLVSGEKLFIADQGGWIRALNVDTGDEVWRYEVGTPLIASPAAGRGVLVVGAEDGLLIAFAYVNTDRETMQSPGK